MSNIRDFIIQRKLGEGSFSEVYQVVRKSDSAVYAMKKVKMQKLSSKEKENALNEVRILASIQHPNVIGYKEAFFEDATNSLCIVMENADGGDVLQVINRKKKAKEMFTEKEIWHYLVQIVRGLKALHDLKICHRDIKSANLFLTREGVIKLGDLNVSKVAKRGMLRTQTGTPYYACPEVWKDMPYDHRSDMWSLGCVLYEMITFKPPFTATTMKGLYQRVIAGKYDPIANHYSADLKSILKSMLRVKASERMDCSQILATPGFLNHITGTLDDIQSRKGEERESLLNTIRCPRNLGMISGVMPAAQYQASDSQSARGSSRPKNQSSQMLDAASKDFKDKVRLQSAVVQQRNQEGVVQLPLKRAQSSSSNEQLKPHLPASRPGSGSSDVVVSTPHSRSSKLTVQELQQKNQRMLSQLSNQNNRPLANVNNLAVIEENADDVKGTGMSKAKVVLQELKAFNGNHAKPPPTAVIKPQDVQLAPKPQQDKPPATAIVEKKLLYRPQQPEQPKNVPQTVDVNQNKNAMYRDLLGDQPKAKLPRGMSISTPQEEAQNRVKEYKDIYQRLNLPSIKPRHLVHQSVDSISTPLLPKISDLYSNAGSQAALAERQLPDMNNLRYHNRASEAYLHPEIVKLATPPRYLDKPRPHSKARAVAVSTDDENQNPVGFRAMLKRHQESQNSHIDRIRKNMPSSSSPRTVQQIVQQIGVGKSHLMAAAPGGEEVMKLKNELAIQRALRLQNKGGYKPSQAAMKQYAPYKAAGGDYGQEQSHLVPPTERYHSRGSRIQKIPECYMPPASVRNLVNDKDLKDLRRIL